MSSSQRLSKLKKFLNRFASLFHACWMKDAKLLRDVGTKAYVAAKAKDLAALEALNAELYEACQSCHVHYRPGYRRRL